MRKKPKRPKPEDTQKQGLLNFKNYRFLIPVGTFLVLFFFTLVALVAVGGETIGASDSRIVRLHVDGDPRVVPTRASTVGELLERLDIKVEEKDIVEPALDTEITEDNFSVNFYKARPVMVVDEGKNTVAVTAQPTAKGVAEEAGVKVYPEDKITEVTTDLAADPTKAIQEGLVAEKVIIERATPVEINLYGKLVSVRTHAKTVGDLLTERNVSLNEGDTITPEADTPLTKDTKILIARFGTKLVTKEEEIPMPIEYIDDASVLMGTEQVKEAGRPGRRVVTYELELKNGREVGRKTIQEIVAAEPVKQVVIRGTKVIYSNPSANVTLGRQIADDMGWGSQFNCIYSIFQRESGWNHTAHNRSSGAYGIPQALPGTKMGPGWQTDPAVQIRWGINYMVGRYGSPCGAQSFWQVNHWY